MYKIEYIPILLFMFFTNYLFSDCFIIETDPQGRTTDAIFKFDGDHIIKTDARGRTTDAILKFEGDNCKITKQIKAVIIYYLFYMN